MTPDDKDLEALFNAAVAGQDKLVQEAKAEEASDGITFESVDDEGEGGEEIEVPAVDAPAAAEVATGETTAAPHKKSAADAITEALIKAKQEAVEALAQTQAEAKSLQDRLLRVSADFENFRKRTRKQQDEMRQFAIEGLLRDLLPVLDSFERALEHAPAEGADPVVQGVRMVQQQLIATLTKFGVVGFTALGGAFDPARHEAVEQLVTDEHPAGMVVREYQKGYLLHDRLLRPAMVVVAMRATPAANAPAPAVEAGDDGVGTSDATREPEGNG
jgi:molecular chaperone GrpE